MSFGPSKRPKIFLNWSDQNSKLKLSIAATRTQNISRWRSLEFDSGSTHKSGKWRAFFGAIREIYWLAFQFFSFEIRYHPTTQTKPEKVHRGHWKIIVQRIGSALKSLQILVSRERVNIINCYQAYKLVHW